MSAAEILDGEPKCQRCSVLSDFILCKRCLSQGASPTWKVNYCSCCNEKWLTPWGSPGAVTCGREKCNEEAIARLSAHLIGLPEEGHHAGQVTS